jgi:hypothetical protein
VITARVRFNQRSANVLVDSASKKAMRSLVPIATDAAKETIKYLKGYVDADLGMQFTADGRPMHPGKWGDITFELMKGYRFRVEHTADLKVKVVLGNDSDHARWVEQRMGRYVVTGVISRHGPFEHFLREAMAKRQGWRMNHYGARGG